MSLEKSIESGKEHRKRYYKSKAIDGSCRNHGSCPWCKNSRTRKRKVDETIVEESIQEWEVDNAEKSD
jgi:hypothetical protein